MTIQSSRKMSGRPESIPPSQGHLSTGHMETGWVQGAKLAYDQADLGERCLCYPSHTVWKSDPERYRIQPSAWPPVCVKASLILPPLLKVSHNQLLTPNPTRGMDLATVHLVVWYSIKFGLIGQLWIWIFSLQFSSLTINRVYSVWFNLCKVHITWTVMC